MRIRKAVVLTAGLGTRLIPFSKEMPKEMLPLCVLENGVLVLKPILQMLYEQLYEAGIREFCFIVGRNKRLVENHFTPDWDFVELLQNKGKDSLARILVDFYNKLEDSHITWVTQPTPLGTGDALLRAERFVEYETFIASAGDNIYLGENMVIKLLKEYDKYSGNFLTGRRVKNPSKYGVILYEELEDPIVRVKGILEKPEKPPANLVNTSLYVFDSVVFKALRKTRKSPRGEIEVTDAIQTLINWGYDVYALDAKNSPWVDVGNAQTYLEALFSSIRTVGDKELIETIRGLALKELKMD